MPIQLDLDVTKLGGLRARESRVLMLEVRWREDEMTRWMKRAVPIAVHDRNTLPPRPNPGAEYVVTLAFENRTDKCSFRQTRWKAIDLGSELKAKARVVTGDLVCSSLE